MFGEAPLIIVEDRDSLVETIDLLSRSSVLGVDTESDSFHHYQEKVCLIQISDTERDVIIDPLKVPDLTELGDLLGDPSRVKILHGADYDIVCLQRDFGFRFRNIFDTMLAAQFLGLPRIGLADLIGSYFGHKIDKKYQRHDWARRPLLDEHLQYARGDTHWLPALREVMARRLRRSDRLSALEEECALLEERKWTGRRTDPAPFLRMKGSKHVDLEGKKILRALWEFRDARARELDRPAFKVMPDPILVDIARQSPQSDEDLHKILRRGGALSRKYADDLLEAVSRGLADERPIPKPTRPERAPAGASRGGGGNVEQLLVPLKNWRNQIVSADKLNPVVVANNGLLKEIARAAPLDEESLLAVPGIRRWQVRWYGDQILEVVREAAASSSGGGAGRRRRRRRKRGPRADEAS